MRSWLVLVCVVGGLTGCRLFLDEDGGGGAGAGTGTDGGAPSGGAPLGAGGSGPTTGGAGGENTGGDPATTVVGGAGGEGGDGPGCEPTITICGYADPMENNCDNGTIAAAVGSGSVRIVPDRCTGWWSDTPENRGPSPHFMTTVPDGNFVAVSRMTVELTDQGLPPTNFSVGGFLVKNPNGEAPNDARPWIKWETGFLSSENGPRDLLFGVGEPGGYIRQWTRLCDTQVGGCQGAPTPRTAVLGVCRVEEEMFAYYLNGLGELTEAMPGDGVTPTVTPPTPSAPPSGFSGQLEVGLMAGDWDGCPGASIETSRLGVTFDYFALRTDTSGECETEILAIIAEIADCPPAER